MPVASAISTHSVQASHHPGAKSIGGRGQGGAIEGHSGPDFSEVLRGQAGAVSQRGEGVAKQVSVPGSEQVAEKASGTGAAKILEQTNGAAGQIKEAVKAKAVAELNSPSAQLHSLSKGRAQSADADNVQAGATDAAVSTALGKLEKDDNAKLALLGAGAGGGKAVKDKNGKDGKSDKADKIIAAQTSAEKPPQIPVAALVAAAASVSAPVLPVLQEKARVEGAAPARSMLASAAKSDSGKQVQQATKTTAAGKTQVAPEGAGLPMPDASLAPEDAQAAAGDLTGDAGSEQFPDIKGAGKQDPAAITAKAGGEVAPQKKHSNLPLPVAIHPTQVTQAAVAGPGETATHISALPRNFANVPSPAVGVLHGTAVGGASPYDRIDQGTAPVVLHAGAQQVAVGIHDPSLGWVEIKTQSAAGHVDATLVASSGQTHDALAAQLPAISQFLEQRDVRVGSLVVNHQSAGTGNGTNHFGNSSGGGGASAQHAGQGFGGNAGSGGNGANNGGERRGPQYNAPISARHSGPVTGAGGESAPPARPLSYISVRA